MTHEGCDTSRPGRSERGFAEDARSSSGEPGLPLDRRGFHRAIRQQPAGSTEIAPDLCLVNLDSEPNQAIELIASLSQAYPTAIVLPASATATAP